MNKPIVPYGLINNNNLFKLKADQKSTVMS
jgi:hypothetical protein